MYSIQPVTITLSGVGFLVAIVVLLLGCDTSPWNDPYPASDEGRNIVYASFTEPPKHLDPVSSYSSNEYEFIGQIYEPPLQYHYLKRPYKLVPLTSESVPAPVYFGFDGQILPASAPPGEIAYSVYKIRIKPGIRYQPHPAFARHSNGAFRYHDLSDDELKSIRRLEDFEFSDTRELVAADYVYQIKRIAHPGVHSPIAGLMSDYIVGLREFMDTLKNEYEKAEKESGSGAYLDLAPYPLEGVEASGRYTYRITIKGKYPQFLYWLAMPFFAPMPWEAVQFYSQTGLVKRNITLDWYPVGTGAFMLVENNPNRRMVLGRNPSLSLLLKCHSSPVRTYSSVGCSPSPD